MILMTVETMALVIALAAIIAICIFLVFHEHYEDGVIGRIAMCLLAFGSMMILARMAGAREGWSTEIDPAGSAMIYGCSAFLCRHLYRFLQALHDPKFHWHRNTGISSPPEGKPE